MMAEQNAFRDRETESGDVGPARKKGVEDAVADRLADTEAGVADIEQDLLSAGDNSPCIALATCVLHGDGFLARAFRARPLRAFGNISYSFYLVHAFCVAVVFHFVRSLLPASGLAAVLACVATGIATFALATGIAAVLFVTLERPYFVWKARRRVAAAVAHPEPLLALPALDHPAASPLSVRNVIE